WQALQMLCNARQRTESYDASATRKLMDALIDHVPEAARAAPKAGGRTPVFIVGMYRSGTTLLEQLLDASPHVCGVGELYDFPSAMRYATDYYCKEVVDPVMVERTRGIDFAEVGE